VLVVGCPNAPVAAGVVWPKAPVFPNAEFPPPPKLPNPVAGLGAPKIEVLAVALVGVDPNALPVKYQQQIDGHHSELVDLPPVAPKPAGVGFAPPPKLPNIGFPCGC